MNYKPFYLPDAQAGKQVITDSGEIGEYKFSYTHDTHERHIFLFNAGNGNHFILSWCDRKGWIHGINNGKLEDYRIGMAPVKKEEWINIHYVLEKGLASGQYYFIPHKTTFQSEQAAKEYVAENCAPNYMMSVKIREWEE